MKHWDSNKRWLYFAGRPAWAVLGLILCIASTPKSETRLPRWGADKLNASMIAGLLAQSGGRGEDIPPNDGQAWKVLNEKYPGGAVSPPLRSIPRDKQQRFIDSLGEPFEIRLENDVVVVRGHNHKTLWSTHLWPAVVKEEK